MDTKIDPLCGDLVFLNEPAPPTPAVPDRTPLPEGFGMSRGLVNMDSSDSDSFRWALTRALNPVNKGPGRVTKLLKGQAGMLKWFSVVFKSFEEDNNVSLLVLGHERSYNCSISMMETRVIPVYVPTVRRGRIARLFLTGKRFFFIKNISALTSSQLSGSSAKRHVCDFCLLSFWSTKKHEKHQAVRDCEGATITSIDTPKMRMTGSNRYLST